MLPPGQEGSTSGHLDGLTRPGPPARAAPPVELPATDAHSRTVVEVTCALGADPVAGLSASEASARLARFGANTLGPQPRVSYARAFLRQFRDPLVLLLIAAVAVSAVIGETVEAAVIGAIVLANAILGFV